MKNKSIVFGGGCFWCTEAVFEMFRGVEKTTPGYAGGNFPDPTYEDVCTGSTGHAEVLKIDYDMDQISLEKLLKVFFSMHDPTSPDHQGADYGSEYRSIILYSDSNDKAIIEKAIKEAQANHDDKIVTEVKKLDNFYVAEDYHKKFFDKNPLQPYCMLVVRPKVSKIKKEFGIDLKTT